MSTSRSLSMNLSAYCLQSPWVCTANIELFYVSECSVHCFLLNAALLSEVCVTASSSEILVRNKGPKQRHCVWTDPLHETWKLGIWMYATLRGPCESFRGRLRPLCNAQKSHVRLRGRKREREMCCSHCASLVLCLAFKPRLSHYWSRIYSPKYTEKAAETLW